MKRLLLLSILALSGCGNGNKSSSEFLDAAGSDPSLIPHSTYGCTMTWTKKGPSPESETSYTILSPGQTVGEGTFLRHKEDFWVSFGIWRDEETIVNHVAMGKKVYLGINLGKTNSIPIQLVGQRKAEFAEGSKELSLTYEIDDLEIATMTCN